MPTAENELRVLVNGQPVGELLQEQQFVFRYHSHVLSENFVSLTMPVCCRPKVVTISI